MTIGYVHLGAPEHGVSRYGRLLAAEAGRSEDLRIVESDVRLTGDRRSDWRRILDARQQLRGADLIHLQYNNQPGGSVWGPGWDQLTHLLLFASARHKPVVATVHDVYPLRGRGLSALVRHPAAEFRRRRLAAPAVVALRWLRHRAAMLFVCSEEERARVAPGDPRVRVIPHFVERRQLGGGRAEAKVALGLAGKRVVTLLGFIHHRKGHRLLVEALSELPEDVVAICAGGPPRSDRSVVPELMALAESRGVANRLRVTGFLPEEELSRYLTATDLAVCPFRSLSASGSLSTWISAERPIVASRLPQIAEYNALEPGAILTFEPYTAHAFAGAIRSALTQGHAPDAGAIVRLRERLRISTVVARHVEMYREVLGDPVDSMARLSSHGREA